jgi:hypothetical protein
MGGRVKYESTAGFVFIILPDVSLACTVVPNDGNYLFFYTIWFVYAFVGDM